MWSNWIDNLCLLAPGGAVTRIKFLLCPHLMIWVWRLGISSENIGRLWEMAWIRFQCFKIPWSCLTRELWIWKTNWWRQRLVHLLNWQSFLGKRTLGSYPCLNCLNCKLMHKGNPFVHLTTGVTVDIRFYLTCSFDWVIYALWCPCNVVHIRETKCDMRTRFNNHRQGCTI